MKTLFVFIILSYSSVCNGQSERVKPIYLDFHFGLMPSGDDIMYAFNSSLGYQFNKVYALGLALNSGGTAQLYGQQSVSGIGLENRFSFRQFLMKVNGGMVTNARYHDGEWCEGDFKSNTNLYFRTGIEYRFHVFSFGLTGIYAPNLNFDLHDFENNPVGSCLSAGDYQIPNYRSIHLAITFGFSFPKLVKYWKSDDIE